MPETKSGKFNDRMRTTKTGLATAVVLILIFLAQCVVMAKKDSVSWDESQHLYSGWLSWKQADFGFNPEVPPLIKMWCAIPLLHRDMDQPTYIGDSFKREGFVLGQRFLATNGIDRTLIPARLMAALLSTMLAITIFLAALEMYGQTAALLALALFCFDPNFLAHGAFVTTDIGASFTLLLSVYLFYRVLNGPSALRVVWLGIAVGMTLTAKFTGIFVVPMVVVIWLLDLWNRRDVKSTEHVGARQLTMGSCCDISDRPILRLGDLSPPLCGASRELEPRSCGESVYAGAVVTPEPFGDALGRAISLAS